MAGHYLQTLFSPASIAVIGASNRRGSVGDIVFRNMRAQGYKGRLYAVNPAHRRIQGQPVYGSVEAIEGPVEMVVICTPAATVPDIIEACGRKGVRAAIVLSAGFSETGEAGAVIERNMLALARNAGLRLLGPNCLGMINTAAGINATFFRPGAVARGKLALVSQSGALCTAILDWAAGRDIGFSSVVSLGASVDVDFGEILDYMANDPGTDSILVYVEGIRKARVFMSALRAAARKIPIMVVKAGRHEAGSRAVLSHTGALVGADDVFDAALRRAGVVRVRTLGGLFAAATSLESRYHYHGNRLAIITNGGGPGVMAVDRAVDLGVQPAPLSPQTIAALDKVLPGAWSRNNPVDILGDAGPERYRDALVHCLADAGVDGVLAILTPQAMTRARDVAETLVQSAGSSHKPLLACWMGGAQAEAGHKVFQRAHVPVFRTPEAAVEAFSAITAFNANQLQLQQLPRPLASQQPADVEGARLVIETALQERRKLLSEMESKAVLSAFDIPVAQTVIARSANEAMVLAQEIGFPVAMKINSPDVTHKTDAGGVRLDLDSGAAVRKAYLDIVDSVARNRPEARLDGVAIEPMAVRPNGRELLVGVITDPVFGPVITVGSGGTSVEVLHDRAVALPPLNRFLARDLVGRTKAARLLGAWRHLPPVDMTALENVIVRVSTLVCELPWLKEMDINPLIVDDTGVLAVDARIVVDYAPVTGDRYSHMAVYPYPTHLESRCQLADGSEITIRPIRPEDADSEEAFVRDLSDETKYFRFMNSLHELTHEMLVRFTQIDYDREMALIALAGEGDKAQQIGVARYLIYPDGETCEFALVVSDAWQGKTIGHRLLANLIDVARSKGLKTMEGEVLKNNREMLTLATNMGFGISTDPDDPGLKKVQLSL